jgi:tetratricopeptide (TPR) repeat protein
MLFLQLKKRWQKTEIILLVSFIAIAMVLTFATYERNKVWKDDISLWQDVVKKSPNNARGHNNLGNAYLTNNLPNKALPHFEIALKLSRDYGQIANYNLGVIYHQKGLIDAAIKKYKMALQLKTVVTTSPYIYADIHNNLALAYQFKKLHHKAIEHFNSAIKIQPNDAYMHNDLGLSYMQVGLIENARKHFQTALRVSPNYKEAQINLRKVQRK